MKCDIKVGRTTTPIESIWSNILNGFRSIHSRYQTKVGSTTTAIESRVNPLRFSEINSGHIACDIYADPIHFSPHLQGKLL